MMMAKTSPPLVVSDEQARRFWGKVEIGPFDKCWPWLGWKNHSGHGRFDLGGRKALSSHVALTLDGRPRPSDRSNALLEDGCGFDCTNPGHLRWGYPKDRAGRRDRLGHRVPDRGEEHGNSKLTAEDVLRIRKARGSQRDVAARESVSQVWVGKIKNRKVWTHLP